MKKICLFLLLPLLFFSCLGVQSEIDLNDDGSGTLALTYRVSQMVVNLGTYSGEKSVIPLPLNEADFRNTANRIPDIQVTSFSRKETAEDVIIQTRLNFSTAAGLSAFFAASGNVINFSSSGGQALWKQTIYVKPQETISLDTVNLMKELFKDYEFSLVLKTPKPVISANIGVISANGREVLFKQSIPEILGADKDIVWEITW
ncbi:MAG: hypothetical protein E4H36_10115 [Spirochaetales bacterium]|nr:MAG: hypothetical protein E4H36_10115 [Spirochaetales bacterium]